MDDATKAARRGALSPHLVELIEREQTRVQADPSLDDREKLLVLGALDVLRSHRPGAKAQALRVLERVLHRRQATSKEAVRERVLAEIRTAHKVESKRAIGR